MAPFFNQAHPDSMALNIKNEAVEALLEEVVAMTGETKTEAVRRALAERRERLALRGIHGKGPARFRRYLSERFWPALPPGERGRRLSRDEEDEILGYGPSGT